MYVLSLTWIIWHQEAAFRGLGPLSFYNNKDNYLVFLWLQGPVCTLLLARRFCLRIASRSYTITMFLLELLHVITRRGQSWLMLLECRQKRRKASNTRRRAAAPTEELQLEEQDCDILNGCIFGLRQRAGSMGNTLMHAVKTTKNK